MTQEPLSAHGTHDPLGVRLPQAEAVLRDARRRLARTLPRDELVWLAATQFDEVASSWNLDILRPGADGRWMRQRHRYDGQSATIYYLGESALTDEQFRKLRASASIFPVAELQDQAE